MAFLAPLRRLRAQWGRPPPADRNQAGPASPAASPEAPAGSGGPVRVEILERRTGAVLVTATIEADARTPRSLRLGRAVAWAVEAGYNLERADLAGADCGGRVLAGARLELADLSGATLAGARLAGARLRGAKLAGADLQGADLGGADLTYANLQGASLVRADLTRARLLGTHLQGASFLGARLVHACLDTASLGAAEFGGADLAAARARDRAPVTRPPIHVGGLGYPVLMLDRHMRVGNELHLLADWAAFEERLAGRLSQGYAAFWRRHGEALLDLARGAGRV